MTTIELKCPGALLPSEEGKEGSLPPLRRTWIEVPKPGDRFDLNRVRLFTGSDELVALIFTTMSREVSSYVGFAKVNDLYRALGLLEGDLLEG